jgi:hypothetical protein
MPISIQCPNPACSKSSMAPDTVSGKSVRCKHCGHSFVAQATIDGAAADTRSGTPTSAEPATALPTVGRFQIRSRLGAGAFGIVYRAFDPQLDREVALKVPNAGVLDSPKRVERFLREAKAAANLRHPHIVPVFDAGKDGDKYFIASAFIAGKKLADTIEEDGIAFERAARLVRELAEALAYAHQERIVHRDVKPDNIMLDAEDRVHLMDFGLAARQDDESKLTNDGAVMGTPSYMAPEQAKGQLGDAAPPADQYSAGIVLYELLTGKTPFEGPPAIVIHNQIHTPPEPPTKFRPGIPRDLETICLKALAKAPADRYPTCQEMADDLRRWLDGEPISARRLSNRERLVRWAKKNKTVAGLTLAVAASLLIGVIGSVGFAIEASRAAALADQKAEETVVALRDAETAAEKETEARKRAEEERTNAEQARAKADDERKKADEERKKAVEAQLRADGERTNAEKAAKEAEEARQKTASALADVQAAQEKIVASERQAREASYSAYLLLAQIQLQGKQPAQAARTLERCQSSQRGWE